MRRLAQGSLFSVYNLDMRALKLSPHLFNLYSIVKSQQTINTFQHSASENSDMLVKRGCTYKELRARAIVKHPLINEAEDSASVTRRWD